MEDFKDYYPCEGEEFKACLQGLIDCQYYKPLSSVLFPECPTEELTQKILQLKDVDEFQATVMYRACEYIINNTSKGLTFSGLENIDGKPHLFISNHRDITVDAILLEYLHISHQFKSTHVVVGSNLFEMPLMALLAKLNKMFGIGRGGNPREFYNSLMTMSGYLRHLVTERHESAWIAQRNGRTKDGQDKTDPAVMKMIASSGDRHNPVEALYQMSIIPMTISYEWEPCDLLKARETYMKGLGPYKKVPGEDTMSIIQGIKGEKGHIHIVLGKPLTHEELEATQGNFDEIAALMDRRINAGYRLWPNNYIAQQLLEGGNEDSTHFTAQEKELFEQHLAKAHEELPIDDLRTTLLKMYAAPLKNIR